MKYHELKLQYDFCDAVMNGEKTFEIRLNDRGYQKGDRVKFIPVSSGGVFRIHHAIAEKEYEITYVLNGWGLKNGYVAFSINEVNRMNDDTISRKAAIDEIKALYEWHDIVTEDRAIDHFKRLPSAQPETPPYVAEIESEYKKWVSMSHIDKPLAKALYEVWKKHDREDVSRNG